jgi:hypothetical protein
MGMSMHDRYYEPEDSMDSGEWAAIQEDIAADLIKAGNHCDWKDPSMFYEALSECGYDEDWTVDNIPDFALAKVKEYCWECAMYRANDIMQDRGY